MINLTYVGVDVSKAFLDWDAPGGLLHQPNAPAPIALLLKNLPPECHFIVEATGGYERPLRQACLQAGRPISVVNPARVRLFARAQGQLAKTDAIDARLLSAFGRAFTPPPSPVPDPALVQLTELLSARDQLVKTRVQLTNALEHATLALVRRTLTTQIRQLQRHIDRLEKALPDWIDGSPDLARRHGILRAQHGVGLLTAATLLALLPELGHANRGQIAALAGLAPFNRDSGQSRGPRFTAAGRPRVRRILYLATLSAIRHPSPLATFYRRLRSDGKPTKVALIAAARKLLCSLNFALKPSGS
jgi:transposase